MIKNKRENGWNNKTKAVISVENNNNYINNNPVVIYMEIKKKFIRNR